MTLTLGLFLSSAGYSQVSPPQVSKPDISVTKIKAEAGDSSAELALGLALRKGEGVQQNEALGVEWIGKAASAGNPEAQNELGIMYMNGSGVEKNKEEALHWYRLAAKQKNAHAMFNLGTAYYNGDGVGIDDAWAYAWFLLAQDNGSEAAVEAVGRAEKELPPATLNFGIEHIAGMYFRGDELNRDYSQGVHWLRKAAANGDVHSQLALANALMDGTSMLPDYDEARQWCEAALKSRNALGAFCLGKIYRKGLGTPKDPEKALTFLHQAADAGVVAAMEQAAEMLANGETGRVDRQEALLYLINASLKGDKAAQDTAVKIRIQMSDKEWKQTRQESEQRFRFFRGRDNDLKSVLQSLDSAK